VKRIWFTMMVLLAVLVWGVGAAPLSGELESTIEFNPSSSGFGDFLADITSTVSVKYAFNGWEFGSKSTYDLDGLALQEFTAFGRLGAFTIDSTMKFDPHVIATVTYALPCGTSCYQTQSVTGVTSAGAPATWTQSIWNCPTLTETATYTAAFSSFEAMAQTFLWGLNLEGLFYLKGDDFEAKTMTGKWVYGNPFAFCGPSAGMVLAQTASYTVMTCVPRHGAGWKYTFSGMIGDILITSRSYFNLEEYTYNELMAKAYAKTYLADTLKLGGSYYLPKVGGETCQVGFTREFITLEGMNLGCAEFDVGLKFTCAGFDWFKILITGAELSSCISFDALITFGITQTQSYKAIAIEPKVKIGNTGCFSFQLALDYTGTTTAFSLNALKINGISMSYSWNGLTFTSVTSFNPVYESLGGYYLAAPVASHTTYGFFIPDKNFTKDKFNITGEGYYTQVCFPEEYYDIWEMFILEGSGDGCCSGTYNWEIKTYFGDRKVLIADSFWFWYKDEDGHSYQYNPATPATRTEPAVLGSGAPYCEDDDVSYGVAYYDAAENALFGLVKSEIEAVIPIFSSFDVTFSSAITVYGWEKLELGFSFRW